MSFVLRIAGRSHWLQTLAVRLITGLHPAIEHNVEKTRALKKAFHMVNLEAIEGDYLEFGMFEGTSFIAAFESHLKTRQPGTQPRHFWGFDSFEGFQPSLADAHPFFGTGRFKSDYERTRRRIERHVRGRSAWTVTPGFLEDTVQGKDIVAAGVERVAVAFIDVDLGAPARIALDYLYPALQNGSVLVLDDSFAYRGSLKKGVAGAFESFKTEHPELVFRRAFDYGYGGQAFVLVQGGRKPS
jgi:hypothetical protein